MIPWTQHLCLFYADKWYVINLPWRESCESGNVFRGRLRSELWSYWEAATFTHAVYMCMEVYVCALSTGTFRSVKWLYALVNQYPKGISINPFFFPFFFFITSHRNHTEADDISNRNLPLVPLTAPNFTVRGRAVKIINRKVLMKYQLGHKRRPASRLRGQSSLRGLLAKPWDHFVILRW